MCGISGIIGPGAERETALLARMSGAVAHRGPDDSGTWTAPGAVLAHRRLSILDRSPAGRQPMEGPGGRVIVYNGEIYNYLELRAELETRGHRFRTGTDTEVLLAAYAQWGEECLSRLNGMWAFALWDAPRRRLFASRDRFGEKPFHYVELGGRLYFASEMKGLLGVPGLTPTLNPGAAADFCTQRVVSHLETTFIREIRQLPAAHTMIWDGARLQIRRYWSLPATPEREKPPADLEGIRSLLEDSVRIRLRADTPVGCLASGGLDSSMIACLMRRQRSSGEPVHLFATLTEPSTPEARGLEHLMRGGGFEPHFHTPTAEMFWKDLPEILGHQEQPFSDGSMAAHYALMREARRAGIPVLLTGQGADELFAGYPTYLWVYAGSLLRAGRWGRALHWIRQTARAEPLRMSRILFYALPARLRGPARQALMSSRHAWVNPDLLAGMKSREIWLASGGDGLEEYMKNSITQWTLPGFLHYEDRNSMAFGVETRLPFLDVRLAEAALGIPSPEHLEGGIPKAVLRRAACGVVPDPIIERTHKQGYPAPLSDWLRTLRDEVRGLAYSSDAEDCPILCVPVWRRCVEGFLKGREDLLDPAWRGLICLLWYRDFLKARRF